MAPDMWLFSATVGLLTAALSGHLTPAPSDQPNTSSAKSQTLEPGQQLGVRLVNGSSRCSGLVEVWFRLSWGPACRALWDSRASEAVCRALGCGGAAESTQPTSPSLELPPRPGAGNASEALNATLALAPAVLCRGAEWRLCYVEERACDSNGSPAEVTCAENRAVRLTGGSGPCAGRVEMLEHRQWGSVCDDSWDLEDSHVVCRQLNCGWAVQALPGLHFAPGRGPIHRDQVNCSGAEAYLWDCPGLPGDGYCGHKEDAGVVCSEHQSWRLTGGADSCEGQVEVHFRGVWSTVCNSEWYSQEAQVLCRALGCGTVARIPNGLPHSLPGRMYYSCRGEEPTLSHCSWRFNNSNLCSQSNAARVLCSGSRSLLNLSTPEVPASIQPITVESSVTMTTEDWKPRELMLLILCITLGILCLGLLISMAFIFLKVKGKYDSQRHRITDEEVQQNRFQMPLLEEAEEVQQNQFQMLPPEEGLEEMNVSQVPPIGAGHYMANTPSLGSQHRPRSSSESSTSSGEDYCNSPSSRLPPWTPQVFSAERSPHLEQPPNLELAGSQATFSAGPLADDSSSTSSGEWYQNFQPPPQPPSTEQFECPGPPTPQPDSVDGEDYDDIGAA
ncbi:T-cell differentiation antigen CD6 isoform X4 [Canis lupus familiaris]|uniref:T-cell differentiation antigen CD6 isoform X4 n=1 Tax=Canis lupus familiaris TaxID=9615 RepID=UPI0003ADD1E7|nr:T-cell differentiation antigen CD6 isoform X4 [Canis lupus familiaris]XP_038420355.1 T-cell differentiation antigen CD6 isoform X4 [Canis lupus familiaris]